VSDSGDLLFKYPITGIAGCWLIASEVDYQIFSAVARTWWAGRSKSHQPRWTVRPDDAFISLAQLIMSPASLHRPSMDRRPFSFGTSIVWHIPKREVIDRTRAKLKAGCVLCYCENACERSGARV